ncbi:MAG: bifunctional nuclease family protein [Chloroflexota bacterium]|nr:bifunctional nuclease family protein [Chloroflexota bacterium]
MVEMVVESVRVSLTTQNRVVILKDKTTERYLLIWIGPLEAWAIASAVAGVPPARPSTHDLVKSVVDEIGAKVTQIVVNDLREETFFARIIMDINGRHVEIDSRPSDAIAVAVRVKAPIYVEETVLNSAGVTPDTEELPAQESQPAEKLDLEKLSAFKDLINGLDTLDDLGKPKS